MKIAGKLVAVMALAAVTGWSLADDQITVAGSSTVKPIVEKAAQEFQKAHPGVKFVIGGGGSSKGVTLAASGEVMLGMASRDLKESEKGQHGELKVFRIGVDGIAMVVNKGNPVTDLTSDQVQKIYTGVITNWKELGGADGAIELTAMGSTHGTHDLFCEHFGLEAEQSGKTMKHRKKGDSTWVSVTAKAVESSKEGIAAVMTNSKAIAYVSIGAAQKIVEKGGNVKALNLDDVPATMANVAAGTYPLCRNLNVLTKGEATGIVGEFVQFLVADPGQKVVDEMDFVTVHR